jgi:hypothetical protein
MNVSLSGLMVSIVMVLAGVATAAAEGLPDILGIQLGMPARDAYAKLQAALPKYKIQVQSVTLPTIEKPVISTFSSMQENPAMGMEADQVQVYVTVPPNKQAVWQVARRHFFPNNGISKTTLLASLREKYGKESRATDSQHKTTTDDKQILALLWLMDEQGRPATLPPLHNGVVDPIATCWKGTFGGTNFVGDVPLHQSYGSKDYEWCLSAYTAVDVALIEHAAMPELCDQMTVGIISLPLGARAGEATRKWKQDIAEGKYKQEIEKANQQEKPKL